jgi:hypothetical protein
MYPVTRNSGSPQAIEAPPQGLPFRASARAQGRAGLAQRRAFPAPSLRVSIQDHRPLALTAPAQPFIAQQGLPRLRPDTVTLAIVREASKAVSSRRCALSAFATRHGLCLRTLRGYVTPTGALTQLGRLLDQGKLHTRADRERLGLGQLVRKYHLRIKDFQRAHKLIGNTAGKISRQQFCELFGFSLPTIKKNLNADGTLTVVGKVTLDRLMEANRETPAPTPTLPPVPRRPIVPMPEVQQILLELAMQHGIMVEFRLGDYWRLFGMPRSPCVGGAELRNDHWHIHPRDGGHYRIVHDKDAARHAVNVLRLCRDGAALGEHYLSGLPDADGTVTLTAVPIRRIGQHGWPGESRG